MATRSRLKAGLRRLLGQSVIEKSRRIVHVGLRQCPVCRARVRRFLGSGFGYPVLEELQVVGGLYRGEDLCPVCHSAARHRLVKHYLERHVFGEDRQGALTVLHVAPEWAMAKFVAGQPEVRYRSGDLDPGRYRHVDGIERIDLLSLPFGDGEVGLLLCNHVLEHVPDDRKAMAEIRRVLSPTGRAILQVPVSLRLETTREGDGSESPDERIRLFGQDNHVRLYAAADYVARLSGAGLHVEEFNAFDKDATHATRLRLDPFERLHVCRRTAPA